MVISSIFRFLILAVSASGSKISWEYPMEYMSKVMVRIYRDFIQDLFNVISCD
jgi:hypothetical protein